MAYLFDDIRYAFRLLLKNPAFTLISVLALALGIGANTVIFSAFNAIMLRPLPYNNPDRIVLVWDSYPPLNVKKIGVTYANVMDWKQRNDVFETLAMYQAASNTTFNLSGIAGPERIQGTLATGDFFRVLGVSPLMGRAITADDEQQGRNHVVVVGFNLWQRYFGGDTSLIGKTIKLNDEDYSIIGVMPQGFEFPSGSEMPPGQQFASATELWAPMVAPTTAAAQNDRNTRYLRTIARLKPGVTVEKAQAEMTAIVAKLEQEHPDTNQGIRSVVLTMRENQVGELRPAMIVLLSAVGFVLLIGCANIANLLLSRAAVRRKEFSIRRALGASRGRIFQQLLTESLLLALIGGIAGLLLSLLAIHFLIAFAPGNIPRLNEISLDPKVLLFTILISLLTGVLFGMAPALHLSKPNLQEDIKEGGRSVAGSGQNRLRGLLVMSEVALVFVLLIAAGLMIRSFRRLLDVSPGFNPSGVLTARVTLPNRPYPAKKKTIFYDQALDKIAHQPGVKHAAIVRDLPFSGTDPRLGFYVEGRPQDQNNGVTYRYRIISPDYFSVMGIPVENGRIFTEYDDENSQSVVIINETCAKQQWPNQNPIGQVILSPGGFAPARSVVIGVVGDVRFGGLDSPTDVEVYYPYHQIPDQFMNAGMGSAAIVVRTSGNPLDFAENIRQQIGSIDKDVPVSSILTLEDLLSNSVAPRRFNLLLLAVFAGVALTLAAVGIYGVISYWVAQRTREIGVRMALGAQISDIFKLVIFQAMSIVLIGLGIGLIVSLGLAQFMSSTFSGLLFGVKALDPITFASVATLLAAVALFACYVPAKRAVKVEPTVALRTE
ncbi:MAG TPA: ABC transporter permease [Blastocatellia bacterium]|nr:ABC transporter permease [Blastocatellia bacterium]